jgi:hypothetical protein
MASLFAIPTSDGVLSEAVHSTLRDAREAMHRSGRLSTRNEAVEEMSKLLFAHLASIRAGEEGISKALAGSRVAANLSGFVRRTYEDHLPLALHNELSVDDFCLRLKPTENHFATELIDAFEPLRDPDLRLRMQIGDAGDILNDTFSQFLASSFVDEKELGQYLTPSEIVRVMVRLGVESLEEEIRLSFASGNRTETPLILDPSCGAGSFLVEAARWLSERGSNEVEKREITGHLLQHSLYGVDKSERMLKLALSSLSMLGTTPTNLHLANSLRRSGVDGDLLRRLEGKAALILTNPPFGANFAGDDLLKYKLATDWSNRRPAALDSELLFMERYVDWLKPGGALVTIVPDSILTNRGYFRTLRDGIWESLEILSVISLPAQTFAAAGTSTKTSILHAKKLIPSRPRSKTYFGVCEHIGFRVVTRRAQRIKIPDQPNDLPFVFDGALEAMRNPSSVQGAIMQLDDRWDAAHHLCQPPFTTNGFDQYEETVAIAEIATLVHDPFSLRGHGEKDFRYIEIGDIDGADLTVTGKTVAVSNAPGRAKKIVRAGDVLVSTVRPERRSVGVVPDHLDGAVCSNGIAVLRTKQIDPYLVAILLRSDVAVAQMIGANLGIAYPAFDEEILPKLRLPLKTSQLASMVTDASRLHLLMGEVHHLRNEIVGEVEAMIRERSLNRDSIHHQ